MAELADAHGSGPCESDFMQVQVLLSAPNSKNPNLVPIGEGFGFLLYLDYPNFNSKLENTNIENAGDKTLIGFISFSCVFYPHIRPSTEEFMLKDLVCSMEVQ